MQNKSFHNLDSRGVKLLFYAGKLPRWRETVASRVAEYAKYPTVSFCFRSIVQRRSGCARRILERRGAQRIAGSIGPRRISHPWRNDLRRRRSFPAFQIRNRPLNTGNSCVGQARPIKRVTMPRKRKSVRLDLRIQVLCHEFWRAFIYLINMSVHGMLVDEYFQNNVQRGERY